MALPEIQRLPTVLTSARWDKQRATLAGFLVTSRNRSFGEGVVVLGKEADATPILVTKRP